MGIIINHEITEPRLNKETQAALLNLARRVLAAYGREGAEVGITLTDEETIHRLNREWRGVDAPTDVLSFPMAKEEPGLPMEPAGADDAPPELLGDVVICLPIALRQAAEYGHSSTREVLYLAVHGLLHLLGFDHQTAEERRRMRDAEEKFLAEAGWGRNNGEDHAEE